MTSRDRRTRKTKDSGVVMVSATEMTCTFDATDQATGERGVKAGNEHVQCSHLTASTTTQPSPTKPARPLTFLP